MEAKLTKEELRDLYDREDKRGQELLHTIFGKEEFKKRPIGVWCLINKEPNRLELVRRADWASWFRSFAVGVVIVTDKTAFIIAPHNTIVAQWSSPEDGRESVELITDKESLNAAQATDRIIRRYDGVLYVDSDGDTQYNFIGSPAADFCRHYSHGSIGEGEWNLPTVAQLKIIAENIAEVNACFLTMGLPPMVMGFYWSSIASENDNRCAWYVSMYYGYTLNYNKYGSYYVRAVSAFQI